MAAPDVVGRATVYENQLSSGGCRRQEILAALWMAFAGPPAGPAAGRPLLVTSVPGPCDECRSQHHPPGIHSLTVLVQGYAYEITNGIDAHSEFRRTLPVTPFAPGDKSHWIEIMPETITGRRISLKAG